MAFVGPGRAPRLWRVLGTPLHRPLSSAEGENLVHPAARRLFCPATPVGKSCRRHGSRALRSRLRDPPSK